VRRLIDLFRGAFLAGGGRPVALLILAVLTTLSHLSEAPPLSGDHQEMGSRLLGAMTQPFRAGREYLFDRYQQLAPRVRKAQPVTIVEIDEASLKRFGQWPWPRTRLADLIDAINFLQPAAIGLDMYMPEPDATSPAQVAATLPLEQKALADRLRALPSHESRLAASLRAAPSVLGAAGFDFAAQTTVDRMRTAPVLSRGEDAAPYLRHFPWVLASLPELQAAAHGQALLSVSLEESIVRRIPLLMTLGDTVVPSLALEMLRVGSGAPAIEARVGPLGMESIAVADLVVPVQYSGEIWLHFAARAGAASRQVSAADVLDGKVAAELFENKLVLVGLTGSGLQDMRTTPLRELVPGIEIQAQVIESLFDGAVLHRPAWLKTTELLLLAGTGLLMIWLIPRRQGRLAAALTSNQKASTWFVTGLNVICLGAGFLVFKYTGLLFDAAGLFIGFSGLLASLVSSAMIEIEQENQRLAAEQQRMREEAARVAGELAAARAIQINSLPSAEKLFAAERRFAVAALLEPAREVGGDLYDFFMLDAHHLFFVIGDVSGKGVPASLFMAVTKALAKSAARRGEPQLAEIIATANREIGAENPESFFVTAIAGIFDADNGRLILCNAGHDAPLCRRADGRIEPLAAASGPPLCVLDGFPYASEEHSLAPGDTLLLFTDGLTEANDDAGELFGSARITAALDALPAGCDAEAVVAAMREGLRSFVGAAEPSDDLTLLVLQRR
jgi:adenylate cyclase